MAAIRLSSEEKARLRALRRRDLRRLGRIARRSPKWPKCERAHLKKFPTCAACGSRERVQVHHIQPFHLRPDLELEPTNLITLCEPAGPGGHHLKLGHLGQWKKHNPRVVEDAARILILIP